MSNSQMRYRCELPAQEADNVLTLEVYDYIDGFGGPWGISAREVIGALNGASDYDRIDVNIHSGGGDLFEAYAIYNRLKSHKSPVHVRIDGLAASAASVIAMAGDVIAMPKNAWLMIHQPWTMAVGNASDFREHAEQLDRNTDMLVGIYTERTGLPADQVRAWVMDETWFDGEQALELGLIDETTQAAKVAAAANIAGFTKAPLEARFLSLQKEPHTMDQPTNNAATLAQIKAACPGADAAFYLDQVEANATLEAAQTSHIETLTAKLENRESTIDELKATHATAIQQIKDQAEQDIEGVKVELGAQIVALREKAEGLEGDLAQVKGGLEGDENPETNDATDPKHRSATSAFVQAVKINRN